MAQCVVAALKQSGEVPLQFYHWPLFVLLVSCSTDAHSRSIVAPVDDDGTARQNILSPIGELHGHFVGISGDGSIGTLFQRGQTGDIENASVKQSLLIPYTWAAVEFSIGSAALSTVADKPAVPYRVGVGT